jgi:hypothetical protein
MFRLAGTFKNFLRSSGFTSPSQVEKFSLDVDRVQKMYDVLK